MKKILALSFLSSFILNVYLIGQDIVSPNIPLVVEPSPTASSLIKQVNDTVDLFTGNLNVDIPLYKLKSYQIELPLSLKYNSSENKVDNVASWVGLGWSLNAGGCISRVMNGLPDEFKGTNKFNNKTASAWGYLHLKDDKGVDLNDFNSFSDADKKSIIRRADWMSPSESINEAYDTRPDEFYFNFCGKYSGKFVFDTDGKIHILTNQNIKIDYTIQEYKYNDENGNEKQVPVISQFVIHTDDGYKYYFGDSVFAAVEHTLFTPLMVRTNYDYDISYANAPYLELFYTPSQFVKSSTEIFSSYSPFTSTWYLMKIESPENDFLTFNYDNPDEFIYYVQHRYETGDLPDLWTSDSYPLFFDPYNGFNFMIERNDIYQTFTATRYDVRIFNRRLRSIITNKGNHIDFIPSEDYRKDLLADSAHNTGDKSLKYIKIYDYDNNLIKSYKFDYTYNEPEDYEPPYQYILGVSKENQMDVIYNDDMGDGNNLVEQRRLLLNKIYEFNNNESNCLPPFEFSYDPQILPRRTSSFQDAWGYFNGNTSFYRIPTFSYYDSYQFTLNPKYIPLFVWHPYQINNASKYGRDLSPNESLAQAAILKRIVYPTNGAEEFSYQLNEARVLDGNNPNYIQNVGGLRISEIKTFSDIRDDNKFKRKEYLYEGGVSKGPGKYVFGENILLYPDFNYSSNYRYCNHIYYSSYPIQSIFWDRGCSTEYKTVKVYSTGNGYDIYSFYTFDDGYNDVSSPIYNIIHEDQSNNINPFPPDISYDWQRGHLKSHRITTEDEDHILQDIEYKYIYNPENYQVHTINGLVPWIQKLQFDKAPYDDDLTHYLAGVYRFNTGLIQLDTIRRVYYTYNNIGNMINSYETKTAYNNFLYWASDELQFSYVKTIKNIINSKDVNSDIYETEYIYPINYNMIRITEKQDMVGALVHMLNNFQYNYPTEIIKYKNDKVVSARLNQFLLKNNIVELGNISDLNIIQPISTSDYNKSYIHIDLSTFKQTFQYDDNYIESVIFDKYNSHGYLQQYHKNNNLSTSYIYGYNGSSPVMEAINANIDDIAIAINDEKFGNFEKISNFYCWENIDAYQTYSIFSDEDPNFSCGLRKNNLDPQKEYILTFDAKGDPGCVLSVGDESIPMNGDWIYYRAEISNRNSFEFKNSCYLSIFIKNVKLHPKNSIVTTYSYIPDVGLESYTNESSMQSTYYDYDSFNRLINIKDDNRNLKKYYDYNYTGSYLEAFTDYLNFSKESDTKSCTIFKSMDIEDISISVGDDNWITYDVIYRDNKAIRLNISCANNELNVGREGCVNITSMIDNKEYSTKIHIFQE